MTTRQRAEATKAKPKTGKGNDPTVTWRGLSFTLPRAEAFPLDAVEAEEHGKPLLALRLILGTEQYAQWRTVAGTVADAEEFSAALVGELGRGNR
ncbi:MULTISPECIES: hypothetical protein [unclassified Crossiella]|uniref:hypothetical protein n=1 Tax=unclassified Crossiella TaxID=2620835 RepID=UPI001FFF85B0|nr:MULTISPECIES: hypothetical protein [unclassified Crossiella]MCK2239400.1 hypothetical protein [Crossiella sp. S99.2]MCK2252095.1 hypothetical protein [Crossiella sp. S99.1]